MTISMYLTLGDNKISLSGNSDDAGHAGKFDVVDFDLNFTQDFAIDNDGELISNPEIQPLTIDLASTEILAKLLEEVGQTRLFSEAELSIYNDFNGSAPGGEVEIQQIKLEDVFIAGVGSATGLATRIALGFSSLEQTTFAFDNLGNPETKFDQTAKIEVEAGQHVGIGDEFFLPLTPDIATEPTNIFVKFNGIDGSSKDENFAKHFDATDVFFDFNNFKNSILVAGVDTARLEPIILELSANDPLLVSLMNPLDKGTTFSTVDISLTEPLDKIGSFATEKIELEGVRILAMDRDSDENVRVALRYDEVTHTTKTLGTDGSVESVSTIHYDISNNAKFDTNLDDFYNEDLFGADDDPENSALTPDPSKLTLSLDGIDSSISLSGENPFQALGFEYSISNINGSPDFSTITVDLQPGSIGITAILDAIADKTTLASATLFHTLSAQDLEASKAPLDFLEKIELTNVDILGVEGETGFATRITLGYDAIEVTTQTFDDKGSVDKTNVPFIFGNNTKGDGADSAANPLSLTDFHNDGARHTADTPYTDTFLEFASGVVGDTKDNVFNKLKAFDVEHVEFDLQRLLDIGNNFDQLEFDPIIVEVSSRDNGILQMLTGMEAGTIYDDVKLSSRANGANGLEVLSVIELDGAFILGVGHSSNDFTKVAIGYSQISVTLNEFDKFGKIDSANQQKFEFDILTDKTSNDHSFEAGRLLDYDSTDDHVTSFMKLGNIEGGADNSTIYEDQFIVEGFSYQATRDVSILDVGGPQNFNFDFANTEFSPIYVDIRAGQDGIIEILDALAQGTDLGKTILTTDIPAGGSSAPGGQVITLENTKILSYDEGDGVHSRIALGYSEILITDQDPLNNTIEQINFKADVPSLNFGGTILNLSSFDSKARNENDRELTAFLGFENAAGEQSFDGGSVDANHVKQFNILEYGFDFEALFGQTNSNTVQDIDAQPFELLLSSYTPGLTALLAAASDGQQLPVAQIALATNGGGGGNLDYQRIELRNVTLLSFTQEGEYTRVLLGYSQLALSVREIDNTGAFQDAVQTIDFNTNDNVIGTSGDDNLEGGGGDDFLFGDDGDDTVNGGTGQDEIDAGSGRGNDIYDGGDGIDVITFRSQSKSLTIDLMDAKLGTGQASGGAIDVDTLINIENIVSGSGDDFIYGDGKDNVIEGAGGADFMDGRGGNDTASYAESGKGVIVSLAGGGSAGDAFGDTLVNFENIIGSAHSDEIAGDSDNNILDGGIGGSDIMTGLAGDDILRFSNQTQGNSTFYGGSDFDTLDLSSSTLGGMIIDPNNARTTDKSSSVDFFSIEKIIGTEFDDSFEDVSGLKHVDGGGGNDFIKSRFTSSTTFDGGAGQDIFVAGRGNDIYLFSDLEHSVRNSADRIFRFEVGLDKIDLTGLGFTGLDTDGGGTEAGELRITYSSGANRSYLRNEQNSFEFFLDGDFRNVLSDSDFIFNDVDPIQYTGTVNRDKINGTDGDDIIDGQGNRDTLFGGLGDDVFRFSEVSHSTRAGSDRILDFEIGVDKVDLIAFGFTGFDTDGGLTEVGEMRIVYSSGTDRTYIRNDQNDLQFFFDGDLRGQISDSDFIFTDPTVPLNLVGTSGRDTLIGGTAADNLTGLGDRDTLTGGLNQDTFIFTNLTDSTSSDSDRITDFEVGVDKIEISGLGFTELDADGGLTEAGELRLSYSSVADRTYIRNDQNSFQLYLDGDYTATLTDGDFIF